MAINTIAIIGTGDMGSAVGRVLREHGLRVITDLSGRSENSRMLARLAGFEDLGSLEAVAREADLVLSILPSAAAEAFAARMAEALPPGGGPVYADCNAVSPERVRRIGDVMLRAGAGFADAGIVGPPPGKSTRPPRLYVSGPAADILAVLDGKGMDVRHMGPQIGRASAMKMSYASLNKGTIALRTAVLMTAQRLGVGAELREELRYSQGPTYEHMCRIIPYLGAVAARWEGEMHEIEDCYSSMGMTDGFHSASAWVYGILAASELGGEKRTEQPDDRDLEEAVEIFLRAAPPPRDRG
jgi:putative dehydrogenase